MKINQNNLVKIDNALLEINIAGSILFGITFIALLIKKHCGISFGEEIDNYIFGAFFAFVALFSMSLLLQIKTIQRIETLKIK